MILGAKLRKLPETSKTFRNFFRQSATFLYIVDVSLVPGILRPAKLHRVARAQRGLRPSVASRVRAYVRTCALRPRSKKFYLYL